MHPSSAHSVYSSGLMGDTADERWYVQVISPMTVKHNDLFLGEQGIPTPAQALFLKPSL